MVNIDFGSYNNEPRQINSYFNLHFDTQKMGIGGFTLIRNSGIFCEAPMYAIILLVTFMFQLFIDEIEFSKRNFYILVVTIITTVTTTGIICTSLMLFLAFVYKKFEVKILKQIKKYQIQKLQILKRHHLTEQNNPKVQSKAKMLQKAQKSQKLVQQIKNQHL